MRGKEIVVKSVVTNMLSPAKVMTGLVERSIIVSLPLFCLIVILSAYVVMANERSKSNSLIFISIKKAEPFDAYLQLGYRQVDLIV